MRGLSWATWHASRLMPLTMHVNRFNYGGPHEFIGNWNCLFGVPGFYEYHFGAAADRTAEVLRVFSAEARRRGLFPVFGCIKRFGDTRPAGMLSFPRPGFGVNVQLHASAESARFLRWFTDYLVEVGARIYLAKDAVLTREQFRKVCPEVEPFERALRSIDPRHRFQSDLSRRLGLKDRRKERGNGT
jgi:decaprenylphospho-beta-D-ribofuranose 2-oxidase